MNSPPIWSPQQWLLIFETKSHWLVERLCPGKFKHVCAAGYVPAIDTWLVYSVDLDGTKFGAFRPGKDFQDWLAIAVVRAGVLRMPAGKPGALPWLTFWCVPAIKHLVGIRGGALWPDQLWRYCLANGAEIVVSEDEPAQNSGIRPGEGGARRG
jgi:hypothetical protein